VLPYVEMRTPDVGESATHYQGSPLTGPLPKHSPVISSGEPRWSLIPACKKGDEFNPPPSFNSSVYLSNCLDLSESLYLGSLGNQSQRSVVYLEGAISVRRMAR
jgi:hypothetical protein